MAQPNEMQATGQLAMDPALRRGLAARRISRRGLLAGCAGAGAAAGLSSLLAACGSQPQAAAAADPFGSAAWWSKQRVHHIVNFANWPAYIDVLNSRHPTLEYFTKTTGIVVNYSEPINENLPFYASIKSALEHRQYTGYDIIVSTNSSPPLGEMMANHWLTPLDHDLMTNFEKYAGPQARNPPWDPGNNYTMAWQSGWSAIGYNSDVVKKPASIGVLFDKKYAGRVGMFSDPQDLGSFGLLAMGVEPAKSTVADWRKAAALLKKQRDDGIVRGYYQQDYLDHLKSGAIVVSMAFSGDIFQADLTSQFKNLKLLMPPEGAMFWTDNMCIPVNAQNPKDAMMLMDFFYQPQVEAVLEYYNDYVCPVPAARRELLHPTGWAKRELSAMRPEIGLPPSFTADAPLVFPSAEYQRLSRDYYQYQSSAELALWNSLFAPIAAGG
ncbi:MAG: spermidine/putrescine ABC transporter substrate-binding protein [Streptosporangiaceae bacterium]